MVPTCVPTDTTLGPPTAANLASRGDQPPFPPSTSLTTSTRDAVPTRRRTACCTDDVQNARPLRPDATTSFTKVGPLAYPPQEGRRLLDFHLHSTSATDGRRLHLSYPDHHATTPRAPISLVRPTLTPLTSHLDSISTRRSTKHNEQHARSTFSLSLASFAPRPERRGRTHRERPCQYWDGGMGGSHECTEGGGREGHGSAPAGKSETQAGGGVSAPPTHHPAPRHQTTAPPSSLCLI